MTEDNSTTEPRYAIGIDLGTTHSSLADTSFGEPEPDPRPLAIPQVIAPGEVAARVLLPSFLYFPSPHQFPAEAVSVPWAPGARDVVGLFARDQGASTPSRLVYSAKSWLSNAKVDRRAAILPWGAPDEVPRVSPLEASARYLAHLRAAWEQEHPGLSLGDQDVVLTVPASFDAVARELTIEAAALAGFREPPRLLEEPQAALYDWVSRRGAAWRDEVTIGDAILVVDIGGGTTDFSLITVAETGGALELERVAVGDHILLGGDNMDLALAHAMRAKFEQNGTTLDDWQMQALTHACRAAKEVLLGDDPPERQALVIPGRSSKLIGGTLRNELTTKEVEDVLLDGFFPITPSSARPQTARRIGLTALGLPYASDAGITRHLAAFLGRAARGEGTFVHPTAILFNGGVTRSQIIRERVIGIVSEWLEAAGASPPRVLSGNDPDLAVGRGAAYYAFVRRRGGVRIRSATAQAYYVGIERSALAVPGVPPRVDAVCVAPFGMEEGSEVELGQSFGLWLGEPVSFRFFGSAARRDDVVGSKAPPGELTELAPIETTLSGDPGHVVNVKLHARVTEVGALELAAVEVGGERRWKLSFDVRVQ